MGPNPNGPLRFVGKAIRKHSGFLMVRGLGMGPEEISWIKNKTLQT